MAARQLATGWLAGAVPEGLAVVGPEVALDVALPGGLAAGESAARLLAYGATPQRLGEVAEITAPQVEELMESLERAGAFDGDQVSTPTPQAEPLLVALGLAETEEERPGVDGWRVIATAEEALLVPMDLDSPSLDRLLNDFVAGLRPDQRRRAYSTALARRAATIWGDRPSAGRLAPLLGGLDGRDRGAVWVIDLASEAELALPIERIGRVGAERAHRLGTVLACAPMANEQLAEFGFHVVVAEHAPADPARVEIDPDPIDMRTKGVARDRELADVIARAEAAERYGAGDATTIDVRRAPIEELDDAVAPDSLYQFNSRQFAAVADAVAADPAPRRLWTQARGRHGTRRWVPADAVLCPSRDPERTTAAVLSTSNGAAAGPSPEEAARSALRELVERDAFMWTWVQRVSRERIDPETLPAPVRGDIALIESKGLSVSLVNLTLETEPVVLGVVHTSEALSVGARCHADPLRAVEGALWEAVVSRLGIPDPESPPTPDEVSHPVDHEELYRSPEAVERAAFLFASEDAIAFEDLAGADQPLEDAVAAIGEPVSEPLFVDLSSPRTHPFSVARAIAPGLIPISFGYDTEPLGAPLLARPRHTADGRTIGEPLDLDWAEPLYPHPFS